MRQHTTVSVIDIDTILEQIKSIIDKASLAVQAVFIFTLAAGIAVLFAAVQSTIDERRFESAMLRALGVRRRTVLSGVLTEFAALGFAAGLLASAGASILAAIVAIQLFELEYTFNLALWAPADLLPRGARSTLRRWMYCVRHDECRTRQTVRRGCFVLAHTALIQMGDWCGHFLSPMPCKEISGAKKSIEGV